MKLLERDAELSVINEAIAQSRAGSGRTVVIEGVAGIGKSSLLARARNLATEAGMLVLNAAGSPLGASSPFALAIELFGRNVTDPEAQFDGPARFARYLFDPDVEPLSARPSEDVNFSTMLGLHWLAESLSDEAPLAIMVDDGQWADGSSLRLLDYVSRRIEASPIVLAVAVRRGDPVEAPAPLAQMMAEARTTLLQPAPLSADAVQAVVAGQLGAPEPEFASACNRSSGGNPFYLDALLTEARQSGVTPKAAEAPRVEELRPDAIRRSLLTRLERLGDEAQGLAGAITALGPGARIFDVAAVAEVELEDAAATLGRMEAAEILASADPPAFRHPLVAESVRERLTKTELRALHLRCAQVLQRHHAPIDQIAAQLIEAHGAGEEWAIDTLREAAKRAMSRGAPSEAAELLSAAIDERPPPDQRAEILVELGLAQATAGSPDAAATLESALAGVGDPMVKAESYLTLGNLLFWGGETLAACESLDRAAAELRASAGGGSSPEFLLEVEMRGAAFGFFTAERHTAAVEQIEEFRTTGKLDGSTIGRLGYGDLAQHALHEADLAGARELADRGLENPQSADFTVMGFEAGTAQIAVALALTDDFDRSENEIGGVIDRASESGSVLGLTAASFIRALCRWRRGALDSAAADAEMAITGYEYGLRVGVDLCHGVLASRALERGDAAQAQKLLAQLPGSDADWPFPTFGDFLYVRSQVALELGDAESAITDALGAGLVYRSIGARYPVIPWRSQAALAMMRAGRADEASSLIDEELELAQAAGRERAYGVALRTRSLISGEIDDLRESVDVLAKTGAELDLARSLVELGAALRRAGQRRECRDPLKQGLEAAGSCGALVLAERATRELSASGGHVPKRPLTGIDSLTPAELRVAELAAEGRSNPEIAARLFVSRRTIETHLSHVYDKLGCGRSDLARVLDGSGMPV